MQITFFTHPAFMKYTYKLFIFLLLFSSGVQAQSSNARLFGYSQSVTAGTASRGIPEEDGTVTKPTRAASSQYIIYLTTAAKTRVYPIEMWIKGEPYAARPEAITDTPVELTNGSSTLLPQKTVLVPKTTQKVTQLIPAPFIAEKSSAKAKALAQQNELVLVYKQGGKTIIKTLKTLKKLNAQGRQ